MLECFNNTMTDNVMQKIRESVPYSRWKTNITHNFNVKKIMIKDVLMFGNKVGFVVVDAECYDKNTNRKIPSYAFLRGDSVSIMPVLMCADELYTVMVTESRTPIGAVEQTGLPAGMIDDNDFVFAALKELEEEVGPEFKISSDDLIDLGTYSVSCGGTDEYIKLFAFERTVDHTLIEKLQGRITGAVSENEHIKVSVHKFDDIPEIHGIDMRSCLSYYKYNVLRKRE